MQKSFHFLAPVEAVKLTKKNLKEVAEWCGGKLAETPSRRVPNQMEPYVEVPTTDETKIAWAFPGMYVTRRLVVSRNGDLKQTWAVFRSDYFEKNYFDTPQDSVSATWEKHYADAAGDEPLFPQEKLTPAVGSVGLALSDAMKKMAGAKGALTNS